MYVFTPVRMMDRRLLIPAELIKLMFPGVPLVASLNTPVNVGLSPLMSIAFVLEASRVKLWLNAWLS